MTRGVVGMKTMTKIVLVGVLRVKRIEVVTAGSTKGMTAEKRQTHALLVHEKLYIPVITSTQLLLALCKRVPTLGTLDLT